MLAAYTLIAESEPNIGTEILIPVTNPIESTFAAIRHRTKRAKGCLTRPGMLHMMFKLAQCAETSWRKLRGFARLADVIEGVDFINGVKPSNPDQAAA